jgi:4-amino-4-deoxy-L-arabinose transferase-like glycosyltransferase
MNHDTSRADLATRELMAELPLLLPVRKTQIVRIAVGLFVLFALFLCLYIVTKDLVALGVTIVCAAMALALVILSRRQMALRIDESGFAVVGGLKQRPPIPWEHTSHFGTMRVGLNTFTTYQFTEASGRLRPPGGMALPGGFDLPPDALAALLNACRAKFTGHDLAMPPIQ